MFRPFAMVLVAATCVAPLSAQAGVVSAELEQQLLPDAPDDSEKFGFAVDLDGDRLAVGAPEFGARVVYLHERNGSSWSEVARLEPFTGGSATAVAFGESLALDGDTLVVGAPRTTFHDLVLPGVDTPEAGAAWVYRLEDGEWGLRQILTQPGGPKAEHMFGMAVALDGDTLAITSLGKTDDASQNGRAWVYVRGAQNFEFQAELAASVEHSINGYGRSALLEGDRLVVPAGNANVGTLFRAGQVYVYRREGGAWSQQAKLSSRFPSALAGFGFVSALHDGRLVVSERVGQEARLTDFDLHAPGTPVVALTELSAVMPGNAPIALAVHGEDLLVSRSIDPVVPLFGVSHLALDGAGWADPTALPGSFQSMDLAFDGERLVVGDAFHDAQVFSSGKVEILRVDLPPWLFVEAGSAGTDGVIPDLLAAGSLAPDSANSLAVAKGRPGAGAILVVGLSRIDAPFKGGVLVPAPDLLFTAFALDAGGELTVPFTWPTGVPSGAEVHVQAWVVDPQGVGGFASSNAVTGATP